MRKTLLLALVAVSLGACQSSGVVKDVHMGAEIAYGPEVMASFEVFDSLKAQPFYSTKSGYGFKTAYTGALKGGILEAWSYGKQFEFTKGTTGKTLCLIQPCVPMAYETGLVAMGEADFVNAAKTGFDFELVGKATKVTGKIPATAFRAVLDLKSRLGSTAPVPAVENAPNQQKTAEVADAAEDGS